MYNRILTRLVLGTTGITVQIQVSPTLLLACAALQVIAKFPAGRQIVYA